MRVMLVLFAVVLFSQQIGYGLEANPTNIDLGVLEVGEKRELFVNLYNEKLSSIRILRITPSCSCLNASVSARIISTHESIPLKIGVSTKGISVPIDGKILLVWRLFGENVERSTVVAVHADVKLLAKINKLGMCLDVSNEKVGKDTIILTKGNSKMKWDEIAVSCESKSISTQVKAYGPDSYEIIAFVANDAVDCSLSRSVINISFLKSGRKISEDMAIQCIVNKSYPFTVTPKVAFFGVTKRQCVKQCRILLAGLDLSISHIESTSSAINVQVEQSKLGHCLLFVTLHAANQSMTILEYIRVYSNVGDVVRIPVVALIE